MPWQRMVADVAGEIVRDEETGIWVPAYPEVVITVPRQQGKTIIVLSWSIDRAQLWEAWDRKPQGIAYSAQNGAEARKKFRKEHLPLLKRSRFWAGVEKPRLAAEDTGLDFKNSAHFTIWNNSEESGHGGTLDLAALDEIFADVDNRREQAVVPAMSTRRDRQKLITSTAGTDKSLVLLRKQRAGRQAVEAGRRDGIAYFEYSAMEGADPEDPATWWSCMPALGHTMTERDVRTSLDELRDGDDLSEFMRACLNIPNLGGRERVIPVDVWAAVCGDHQPGSEVTLAIDGTPDQRSASLTASDPTGTGEVIDHHPGTGWLLSRTIEVAHRHNAEVVVDQRGPVGFLIEPLQAAGVDVAIYNTADYAYACASFVERVSAGTVAIREHKALTDAVAGAKKRQLGDVWVWARKGLEIDISPLVAMTLAIHRAAIQSEPQLYVSFS